MRVIGIDPGNAGAIACWEPDLDILQIWDIPSHTLTVQGSKRKVIDEYELSRILRSVAPQVTLAVIEDVHSMPKQGVASSFAFGYATGVVRGVITSLEIPIELVSPLVWKKGLRVTADKDSCRRRASQIFPRSCALWSEKEHHDRAEAALLAYFGVKFFKPISSGILD